MLFFVILPKNLNKINVYAEEEKIKRGKILNSGKLIIYLFLQKLKNYNF